MVVRIVSNYETNKHLGQLTPHGMIPSLRQNGVTAQPMTGSLVAPESLCAEEGTRAAGPWRGWIQPAVHKVVGARKDFIEGRR